MKVVCSILLAALTTSCYPESGNSPYPVIPTEGVQDEDEGQSDDAEKEPDDENKVPVEGELPGTGNEEDEEISCPGEDTVTLNNNAHEMLATLNEKNNKLSFSFADQAKNTLRVISFYITDEKAVVPIFPNFELKGTAYWMVSLDDPFETYTTLPINYGEAIEPAIDVSANYDAEEGGSSIDELTSSTCLKATAITFEPEEETAFKNSELYFIYEK